MSEGEPSHGQFFEQYMKMANTYKGNRKISKSMRHLIFSAIVFTISFVYFVE